MARSSVAILGQLSDIDLRLLRVFKVVAEAGGFSAAELELNIGRSTISRHIKDLEIRLGVVLCQRGRGGFSLTDEGRQIYQATLTLLASLEIFRGEVVEVHRRMTGHLTIALFDNTVSNPEAKIHQAIRLFDDIAPEVTLNIDIEPTNEIERGVMEGRIHLGIIPAHRSSPSLNYEHLYYEQMYLYCGREHPLFERADNELSVDEVKSFKYAGLGYHSPNMKVGNSLGLTRSITVNDQEAIVHCLLSGRYVGYLPNHYAEALVEKGLIRAIELKELHYECDFLAIHRLSPKPSRVVETFMDCLREAHNKNLK
jgi:DNA-binding transcriptional LysR family regulator